MKALIGLLYHIIQMFQNHLLFSLLVNLLYVVAVTLCLMPQSGIPPPDYLLPTISHLRAPSNPTNIAPPIGNLSLAILPWCEDVLACQMP